MSKTGIWILVIVAGIATAWLLSSYLGGTQGEQDALNEIDALDTELNTEVAGNTRLSNDRREQVRARLLQLREWLAKRGKKVCRNTDGTLSIQKDTQPC